MNLNNPSYFSGGGRAYSREQWTTFSSSMPSFFNYLEVNSAGANTYLYCNGRIGEDDGAEWGYYLADADH